MPKTINFKINKFLFPFVWNKKREWMARSSVIQPLSQGGLGVVDISDKLLSLRSVWLRRFFSHPHHPWSSFFSYHFILYFINYRPSNSEHRCVTKFREFNIPVAWKQAWASLRLWLFVRAVQDTAWLSFHGILPTADRLVRFSMKVSPLCFCGETETLLHMFTSCPFALDIVEWFKIQQRKHHHESALTTAQILFGFESASNVPIVFTALLGILRHHIWLARNKQRFEHVTPDAPLTIKNAKSTFRFLV